MNQIFYVTLDPEKALGVEDLLPSYHILYSENSQLTIPIKDEGIDIQNFPKPAGTKIFSTSKLLGIPELQKYIERTAHGKPDILVFKNDRQIQKACQELGYNLLNPTPDLAKKLENKVAFSQFLEGNDMFQQPDFEKFDKLSDTSYEQFSQKFGHEFVVQFMFGHSGNSTFFVKTQEEHENLKRQYPLRMGKVTRMIKGVPYTVNGCVTRLGVVIGGISEQITGIELLTSSKGGTVGNDFTQRHLDDSLRHLLIMKATEFGNMLMKEGHKGIFGMDFLFDLETQAFFLIEANIRQTASCSYYSYLQRERKQVPIMLWHMLELLNHNYYEKFQCLNEEEENYINLQIDKFRMGGDKVEANVELNQPIKASQIFFRNVKDFPVKVVDQFPTGIFRIRGRMPDESAELENAEKYPAVYKLREAGTTTLCLIKRGYNIMQATREDGFLITAVPENTIVQPLGEIGRIQINESAFGSIDDMDINGWIVDVIKGIYENTRLMKFVES